MQAVLKNKVVVLTGAGGGIGSAIAEKLSRYQMKIVLAGGNNIEKLQKIRAIVEQHTSCMMLPGDITAPDFPEKCIEQVSAQWGGIDVLINNAGMTLNAPVEDVTPEIFDKIMNINVKAPFFLTQKALKFLRKSSAATIINICSVVAHSGYPAQSAYSASKHALLGWTKSLAAECYQDNIRVHAISPGGVYTDMVKISRPDLTADGMIMPEEIADVVEFLLTCRGNAIIDEILLHRANKTPFLV